MIGVAYWDRRLHLWGAWLATDGGRLSSTPLARMRALGVRIQEQASSPGMVHDVERETDAMIGALALDKSIIVHAYYRHRFTVYEIGFNLDLHPDTIRKRLRDSHHALQRMMDERRRGEPARRQPKALTITGEPKRGRGRTMASVVPD
jgi:hypothetical protein